MAKASRTTDTPMRRSEIVTVRLDPRLKHLAEIAARKQRRTLSGYIEWAVERSLSQVILNEGFGNDSGTSVEDAERMYNLWDVDEAERLAKLALYFPELMTFDEQLVWRLVRDCGALWRGRYSAADRKWEWTVKPENLIWDRLRQHWPTLKKIAAKELPLDALPTWVKVQQKPSTRGDLDDDVPF